MRQHSDTDIRIQEFGLFRNIVVAVWIILAFYTGYYYFVDAKIALIAVTLGTFIFSPILFYKSLSEVGGLTKLFFMLSCNFYIYFSGLSFAHTTRAEYYYLPAAMLPLLFFSSTTATEKKYLYAGILTPLGCWTLTQALGYSFAPAEYLNLDVAQAELLRTLNFVGAFSITIVILYFFMESINLLQKEISRQSLEKQKILEESNYKLKQQTDFLNISQTIARLGNWSFNTKTKQILWSEQMFELFLSDRSKGEPSFEQFRTFIHPDDVNLWANSSYKCIDDGKPFAMRFRILADRATRDIDNFIWIESKGEGLFDEAGKVSVIYGTCQDITEQVRMSEQVELQKIKEIQLSKLASIGEMAAGVAHEINTPLGAMILNAEMIEMVNKDKKYLDESITKRATTIINVGQRISKIITSLKTLSRESENTDYQQSSVKELLEMATELCREKFKNHGIELNIVPDYMDTHVYVQPVRVTQTFINLLNNAFDAVSGYKEKWISIKVEPQTDFIDIKISDSGQGIAEEHLKKIFQPFYTTKGVGKGTGLGLSISESIIKEQGGELLYDKSSKNTCFVVRLPLRKTK